jgi:hypothetical protein
MSPNTKSIISFFIFIIVSIYKICRAVYVQPVFEESD